MITGLYKKLLKLFRNQVIMTSSCIPRCVTNTLCPEKASPTLSTVTWKPVIRFVFDNFWYEYSWSNLPSNDHSVSHLTQRLFLHYLGKTQTAKYHFYPMRYDCLINITHKTHFVYISDTLADILSSCPFSTACCKIAWSVGPLCEHRQGDAFTSSMDNVLLQGCTSRFLTSQTFLNFIW